MEDSQLDDIFADIPIKDNAGQFKNLAPAKTSVADDPSLDLSEKIATEAGLSLADEVLNRRFKNVILAALKEIRNEVQTHDALTRAAEIGGLGLSEELARRIMSLVKQNKGQKMDAGIGLPVAEKPVVKKAPLAAIKPVIKELPKEKEIAPPKKFTQEELDHEIMPPLPAVKPINAAKKAVIPPAIKPQGLNSLIGAKKSLPPSFAKATEGRPAVKPPVQKSAPLVAPASDQDRYLSKQVKPFIAQSPQAPKIKKPGFWSRLKAKIVPDKKSPLLSADKGDKILSPAPKPTVAIPSGREKITDIKVPTRLTGPMEELQNFRLADFRQLNPDPGKAILKIKEKIDLLETQSFAKRLEGISSWKKSEVYRLYLLLGKESIETRKPLDEIANNYKVKNQPYLSQEEFLALGKLSKMVEY